MAEHWTTGLAVKPLVVITGVLDKLYKDQLSLTNPRDALHHGERAANK